MPFHELASPLAQDAVSWSDGGGNVRTNLQPIHGKLAVAWFWLSVTPKTPRPLTFALAEINGSPAPLCWDEGSLAGVISLTLSARVSTLQEEDQGYPAWGIIPWRRQQLL